MTLEADQFTETVARFCEWAEGQQHSLLEGRQLLISLIASVPDLMEFRYSGTSDIEFPRREHAGWTADHKRFSDLPFQYYQVVFDPFDFGATDEPVTGDLSDDFADIYGDLWHGLQAQRAGDPMEAISLWMDSYVFHWGQHATQALSAIDAFYRQDPNRSEQVGADQPATAPETKAE